MGDQLLNLNFVRAVEKHPELYNFHLRGYSRKDLTEKAWNEVGKEFDLTVSACKDKWKNLRSVFVRNQKIPLSGLGHKNKKPYYLSEAMKFTLPFIKSQVLMDTVQEPPNHEVKTIRLHEVKKEPVSPDVSEDPSSEGTGVIVYDEIELQPETSSDEQSRFFEELTHHESPPSPKQEAPKRKRMMTDEDNNYEEFARTTKVKKQYNAQTSTSNCSSAEKKMFLLSLLPEIEPLTDSQMRSFRRRVLQLIDDIVTPSNSTSVALSTE